MMNTATEFKAATPGTSQSSVPAVKCPMPVGVDDHSPSALEAPGMNNTIASDPGSDISRSVGAESHPDGSRGSAASGGSQDDDLAAKYPGATNVYFTKLAPECFKNDLAGLVAGHGEAILEVRVLMHSGTGQSRGQGFVKYATMEEAKAAVKRFDKQPFMGKDLCVCLAFDNNRGVCSDFSPAGRVFVRGIPRDVTHAELVDLVTPHAVVRGCTMHLDRLAGQAPETVTSKFAYVVVDTDEDADAVVAALHQTKPWPQGRRTIIARLAPRKQRTQEEIAENAARHRANRHLEFWGQNPANRNRHVPPGTPMGHAPPHPQPGVYGGFPAPAQPALYQAPQLGTVPGAPVPMMAAPPGMPMPYGTYPALPQPGLPLPCDATRPAPPLPSAHSSGTFGSESHSAAPQMMPVAPQPMAVPPGYVMLPAGGAPPPSAPPAPMPNYGAQLAQPPAMAGPPPGHAQQVQWQYVPPPPPPQAQAPAAPPGMMYIPPSMFAQ